MCVALGGDGSLEHPPEAVESIVSAPPDPPVDWGVRGIALVDRLCIIVPGGQGSVVQALGLLGHTRLLARDCKRIRGQRFGGSV